MHRGSSLNSGRCPLSLSTHSLSPVRVDMMRSKELKTSRSSILMLILSQPLSSRSLSLSCCNCKAALFQRCLVLFLEGAEPLWSRLYQDGCLRIHNKRYTILLVRISNRCELLLMSILVKWWLFRLFALYLCVGCSYRFRTTVGGSPKRPCFVAICNTRI